jgi:ketosteroid isomerase-like protein
MTDIPLEQKPRDRFLEAVRKELAAFERPRISQDGPQGTGCTDAPPYRGCNPLSGNPCLPLKAAAICRDKKLDHNRNDNGKGAIVASSTRYQEEDFMRFAQASAFALFLLAATPVGSVAADPRSDVTAAYAAWDAAYNKGDAKAVAASYLPNAKLLPPSHEVASGPEAIEKFIAGLQAKGITDHKLEVIDAGGDDKIVFSTANWSVKGKDKEGKPATFSGLSTLVFERQADNSLKIRLHTFN